MQISKAKVGIKEFQTGLGQLEKEELDDRDKPENNYVYLINNRSMKKVSMC